MKDQASFFPPSSPALGAVGAGAARAIGEAYGGGNGGGKELGTPRCSWRQCELREAGLRFGGVGLGVC